jgi:hypothetical protein
LSWSRLKRKNRAVTSEQLRYPRLKSRRFAKLPMPLRRHRSLPKSRDCSSVFSVRCWEAPRRRKSRQHRHPRRGRRVVRTRTVARTIANVISVARARPIMVVNAAPSRNHNPARPVARDDRLKQAVVMESVHRPAHRAASVLKVVVVAVADVVAVVVPVDRKVHRAHRGKTIRSRPARSVMMFATATSQ